MQKLTIEFESLPGINDVSILTQGLSEQAAQLKGLAPATYYAFFIRDLEQKIVGGINGSLYYGCVYIDQLWLAASLRGHGWGKLLIYKVETLAQNQHCRFATVNTMDWEAKGFYEKLGYRVEYVRCGYLKQSKLYFLIKDL
jgi:GNAT superfamily N-acetyltransferase